MKVGIGILGGGNVGGRFGARKLLDEREMIAAKAGIDLELRGVAVRDIAQAARRPEFPAALLMDRPEDLVDDPAVQLVVELMGGLEPGGELVLRALRHAKPVVTANKELVAARGVELIETAAEMGVSLLFEAAVGGGIPIIRPYPSRSPGSGSAGCSGSSTAPPTSS